MGPGFAGLYVGWGFFPARLSDLCCSRAAGGKPKVGHKMPMNDAELHDWENASDAEKVKIAQSVKARYAAAVAKLSPEWDGVIR